MYNHILNIYRQIGILNNLIYINNINLNQKNIQLDRNQYIFINHLHHLLK